jgi:hypothetical protein
MPSIVNVARSSRDDNRPRQYDAASNVCCKEYMFAGGYIPLAAYEDFQGNGLLLRCLDENDGRAIVALGSDFFVVEYGRNYRPLLLGSLRDGMVAYLHMPCFNRVVMEWVDARQELRAISSPILLFTS